MTTLYHQPDPYRAAQPAAAQSNPASRVVDTLARTIYGEARGELVRGKEAIAAVIINRVRRARERGGHYWWGADIEAVCTKPYQFSCWNVSDPNRAKIEAVGAHNRAFQNCLRVARRAVNGTLRDHTKGATHYHVRGLFPPWARGKPACAEIGRHQFYNNIE